MHSKQELENIRALHLVRLDYEQLDDYLVEIPFGTQEVLDQYIQILKGQPMNNIRCRSCQTVLGVSNSNYTTDYKHDIQCLPCARGLDPAETLRRGIALHITLDFMHQDGIKNPMKINKIQVIRTMREWADINNQATAEWGLKECKASVDYVVDELHALYASKCTKFHEGD